MSDAAPSGIASDNDYVSRPGQKDANVPVQSDDAPIEPGVTDPSDFQGGENSDEQLEADDKNAIDTNNIIGEDTERSAKPTGSMAEPGDEEGLPGAEDGTSSVS